MVTSPLCSHPACRRAAKAVLGGRWYCGFHHVYARQAAERMRQDAVEFVEGLIDVHLPEMREQDSGMLERIATRPDEDGETDYDMRLHIAARKLAAQRALAERQVEGAVVCA